ncbi:MAG: hypothetical protein IPJ61_19290 [Tessaracoccus sp.]|uniref:hypothetical protein n=1 Tax=Tessaracoccus sp. TaxID=1971211 RepID=UPI001ED2776C|nr:hypothetical protein [Tessaracoccus sp.]MBK7823133.1 hypothetical protein [Tessaracoccus sp.]
MTTRPIHPGDAYLDCDGFVRTCTEADGDEVYGVRPGSGAGLWCSLEHCRVTRLVAVPAVDPGALRQWCDGGVNRVAINRVARAMVLHAAAADRTGDAQTIEVACGWRRPSSPAAQRAARRWTAERIGPP